MKTNKILYQWDAGQKLTDCRGVFVDFVISGEVYRCDVVNGECIVPDELLQHPGKQTAYECMADNTLQEFVFSVVPRPLPPDYVYTPTEKLTFEGLVQKVEDTVADIIRRADTGEFDGYTPVKGKDYFTESEKNEMMQRVSDGAIGEFLEVVDSATAGFNKNSSAKTNDYNTNAEKKVGVYDSNAAEKLKAYNDNHTEKMTAYDANATDKLSTYNRNDEQHTTDYNRNAEQKLEAYNQNNTEKVAEYNTNAETKTAEFDANAAALQTEVDRLRGECDTLAAENRKQENKISALIKLNKGQTYDVIEKEGEAYSVDVPSGSKYLSVDKVGGKSVVFEQRIKPENIGASKTENGITFTNNGDGTVTVSGTASANVGLSIGGNITTGSLKNKPFVLTGCPKGGSSNTYYMGVGITSDVFKWDKGDGYYKADGYEYGYELYIYIMSGAVIDTPIIFKPNLFIINQSVFQSLDVFKQMFTNDYYPYCEPTIISSQTDRLEVSIADGTTQQITTNFPVLNSAGSVYDYIDLNEWKLHQRVGVVDLGSLDWVSTITSRFNTLIYNIAVESGYIGVGARNDGLLCPYYSCDTQPNLNVMTDNTMLRNNRHVYIRDTAYTDSTSFKEAMKGVMLYYELAEEVITDIEIPTELTDWLTVEAGGSVTFHNSDDTKQLPVPNAVSWVRKLNEVE